MSGLSNFTLCKQGKTKYRISRPTCHKAGLNKAKLRHMRDNLKYKTVSERERFLRSYTNERFCSLMRAKLDKATDKAKLRHMWDNLKNRTVSARERFLHVGICNGIKTVTCVSS